MKFPSFSLFFFSFFSALFFVAPLSAQQEERQPEMSSGYAVKKAPAFKKYAIVTANPYASQVGQHILAQGGSALDAAIAVQMVLGLVEPQSSGIGGGAFLLYWDGKKVEAYDGREMAPAHSNETLFLQPDQKKPLDFDTAIVGGRAVGVPSVVAMLEMAHREQGQLPWAQLFQPAIALAENGFAISPRLYSLLKADPHLKKDPVASAYFYQSNGEPWPIGTLLKNKPYATILRQIAKKGARALTEGPIADAIIQKVHDQAGLLTHYDLTAYQAKKRKPLCLDYTVRKNIYQICGMPPPSSGLLATGQILGLLSHTPAAALPLEQNRPSATWLHFYVEAARLAFADRAQYVGDPDFVLAPARHWEALLDPTYLAHRAQRITTKRMSTAPAGIFLPHYYGKTEEQPEYGTSHISIIDQAGHALSMTASIEAQFGSRQMVNPDYPTQPGGFLLNNQLSDFNFKPYDATGKPTANRVEPHKRPRSTMNPLLVFDKKTHQLFLITGSAGGSTIIHHSVKTLYGLLHWDLNAQQAANLPNFGLTSTGSQLETKRFSNTFRQQFQQFGHTIQEQDITSGVQTLVKTPAGIIGGTDPRREGVALGE